MHYSIRHITRYSYTAPVNICYNKAVLRPRDHAFQTRMTWDFQVSPSPAAMNQRRDYFGNDMVLFTVQEPHADLEITARSHVHIQRRTLGDPENSQPWERVRGRLAEGHTRDLADANQYLFESPLVALFPELRAYAMESFTPERPVLEAAHDLAGRIYREFKYTPSHTTVATTLMEIWEHRRGVCQDFAQFMIGCLRSIGLPARYVSGYILTAAVPGRERLVGADASHAWVSLFVPGLGWVDIDPTNNKFVSDEHITLGWGRDFLDVSPLQGVILGGGRQGLSVEVDVTPVTPSSAEKSDLFQAVPGNNPES